MTIDEFLFNEISKVLPKGGLVLDVGGGNGKYAKLFADKGFEVDILDKEFSGAIMPRMHFIKTDLRHWTASAKEYHLVIVRSVLHYFNQNEAAKLLDQLPTLLADEGFLYVTSLTPADDSRYTHTPEFIRKNLTSLELCFLNEHKQEIEGQEHYFWRTIFQKGKCSFDRNLLQQKINDLTKS